MNREQKMAWLAVWCFAAGLVIFLILFVLTGHLVASLGGFGVFGISGLGPLLFAKPKGDIVEIDERDKDIGRKATLGGAMTSYGLVILCCMAPWFVYRYGGGQDMISIHVLPGITFVAGISFFLARSITLLILYGREGKHGQE